jgi:hypothetical protein
VTLTHHKIKKNAPQKTKKKKKKKKKKDCRESKEEKYYREMLSFILL